MNIKCDGLLQPIAFFVYTAFNDGSVEIYCERRFRSPFNSTANLNLNRSLGFSSSLSFMFVSIRRSTRCNTIMAATHSLSMQPLVLLQQ